MSDRAIRMRGARAEVAEIAEMKARIAREERERLEAAARAYSHGVIGILRRIA